MGFFSWKTSDTNRSISNQYSSRGTFPVYVLIPQEFGGGYIKEENYEGYGVFGGKDIYTLVANWNCPEKCVGDDDKDRDIGIDIACYDEENDKLKYPIKITEKPMKYEDAKSSDSCPDQGYFYDDEEDDYDEEEDDEDDYYSDHYDEDDEE
jgi:hypothetical protein